MFDASIQTTPAPANTNTPLTVGEGTPVTAGATTSGPTPYTFNWSLTQGMSTLQTGSDPTFNFTVYDDANVTVHLDFKDGDGVGSSDARNVVFTNVAPTVSIDTLGPTDEGGLATVSGTYTDPGIFDSQTLVVDWDDPNNLADSTFAIPGLKDTNGVLQYGAGDTFNSSTDTAVLTITSIDEATGTIGFSVQSHTYFDDGAAPGNNTTSDTSTVKVIVTDDDMGSGSDTESLLVKNVAPTVALNAVPDINENGTATLTGNFTDSGILDHHTLTVDWDDPNDIADSTFDIPALKDTAGMATLSAGDTFNSTTDLAVLTITSVNTATGQVGFSVQNQYLDDGPAPGNNTTSDVSHIVVTVADDDGQSGNAMTDVLVKNVAPTVALDAVPDITENGAASITGKFIDVGVLEGHTLTVDWDDVNNTTDSTFLIPSMKDTAGMVTLNVGDIINSSTDSAVLTITSVNVVTGEVGFSISSHQYLDDGLAPGNNTASDVSTIAVKVVDDDTGSGSNSATVLVKNAAPTVLLNGIADIDEGGTATLTGKYTDIGQLDRHKLTVDWQDQNNAANSTFQILARKDPAGMVTLSVGDMFNSSTDSAVLTITSVDAITGEVGFSVQHQYLDDGLAPGNNTVSDASTIGVTVADDDSQSGSDTENVLVKNITPTVALNAVPDIHENGTVTLSGTYTDAGLLDGHMLTVDWDDPNTSINSVFSIPAIRNAAGTATLNVGDTFTSSIDSTVLTITSISASNGQVSFGVQHQYLDDGIAPGNNTTSDSSSIVVTVNDDDSGSGNNTTSVLVKNVAPTVALNAVPDINENGTATLTGTYTDIGLLDGHTLTVDWDDPNNAVNSTFAIPAIKDAAGMATLSVGDMFNSSTDLAVLTITSINAATGQVSFTVQHQYLDDGVAPGNSTTSDVSMIGVTVADDDSQSGADTETVLVKNVAPTVTLSTVPDVNENGVATLTGSYTDVGQLDRHTLTVNWDDPNNVIKSTFAIPALKDASGLQLISVGDTFNSSTDSAVLTITSINAMTGEIGFSVQHQYLDDGLAPGNNTVSDVSTIGATVTDDDTNSGSDTEPVLVRNVAPTVALNAVPDINENGTATLTGTYTDIGLLDGHTLTVNWDDPNNIANSTFTIPAIKNAAGMATLSVGDMFNSSTDLAVLTITSINAATGEVGFSVQHQYLDDGPAPGNNTASDTSTIGVTVADDDAQNGSDTENVLVKNVAPTVALNAVPDINENGTATLNGTYTDMGILDAHTLTVDWDDPNNGTNSTFSIPAFKDVSGMVTLSVGDMFNSSTDDAVLTITSVNAATGQVGFSVQHQYLDDGLAPGNNTASDVSTIGVNVADDDAQSGSDTEQVLVKNVAPTVALNAVPDINENGTATLTGSYTDIGRLDGHTLTVNWDDPNDAANSTFTIPAIRNAAGTSTLTVGDTFNSSTDDAVLTITSIDATTGQVGFSVQHQYLDDGLAPGNNTASDTSMIGVTVADDDTQSGSDTENVLVKNVAPSVALNAVPDIDENGTATLTGSYTDIGRLDGHTLTVDWDDPNNSANSTFTISAIRDAGGNVTLSVGDMFNSSTDGAVLTITSINAVTGQVGFSVQHQYLDDGLAPGNNTASDTSTISVTVADDDTQSGSDTETMLVTNVAPTVALNAVPDINENGTATLTGSYTDIGLLDQHTLTVDWDDPNNAADSTFAIPSIRNAAGVATLSAGDMFNSSTDGAVLTITSINAATGQVGFSVQHQYLDDGLAPGNNTASDTSTIGVTVADDDTQSGSDAETVLVKNVAPTVALNAVPGINENGTATLTGSYTDIGFLDGHTLIVDWDDPNNAADSTFAIPSIRNAAGMATLSVGDMFNSSTDGAVLTITSIDAATGQVGFSVQHQYLDDGLAPGNNTPSDVSTIGVTVADDDTQNGSDTETVQVNNVAPTVALNAVPDIDENGTATLTGSYTDIGLLDGHTLTVDWDDPNNAADSTFTIPSIRNAVGMATLSVGDMFNSSTDGAVLTITSINAITGQVSFSVQHQYLDDGLAPGNNTASDTSTIGVTVADDDMQNGSDTETVLVKNVAPTVALNAVPDINENGTATLNGTYTDIGLLDGHTLTVDWDDPNNAADSTFVIPAIRNAAGAATLTVGDMFNSSTDGAVLTITSINALTGEVGFSVQHQYLDDGLAPGNNTASDTSTIGVTVADDDTQNGSDTEPVLVNNLTPVLTVVPNQTRNEGQLLNLSGSGGALNLGSFTDVGTLDLHKAQIDWGDGHVEVGTVLQSAGSGFIVGSHTYADDGVYTVVVRLADDDMSAFSVPGNFNTGTNGVDYVQATFTVTVSNVAPSLTDVDPANVINEGQAFVISNLPGGTLPNLGVGLSDPGFDNPLNPTTPTIGDPFQETFTGGTINWGDGTAETPVTVVLRVSGSPGVPTTALFQHAAHTFADDGVYTVRVRVADDNMSGNFATGTNGVDFIDLTFTITVQNVNPTFANFTSSTTTINEAGSVNFNINFSDPGFDNPANPTTPATGDRFNESFNFDINWGDGRQTLNAVAVADANGSPGVLSTGTFGGNHIYADDGTYTVTVVIRDDNGGTDTHVFTVIVQNVNPSFVPFVPPSGIPQPFQGSSVTSTGFTSIHVNFNDPGFDNTANPNPDAPPNITDTLHESFTHVVDWGDGTVDAVHTYVNNGVFTVNLTITGPSGTQTFSFAGFDSTQFPVLTLVNGQAINDPSVVAQLYTFVVDWGDGDVQTIPLMLRNPGAPLFNNGLTTVVTSVRTSGNEGILTTGSFEIQHRYEGPPNPDNPTADIKITTTVVDDNNGSVSGFILIANPGINSTMTAIDTTPLVPRLDFIPTTVADVFLGQIVTTVQSLQTLDTRAVRSDQNLTSDVYLELRVVLPNGDEVEPGYRMQEDALHNLRDIFAKLPDNRYRIYLVRTENNSRRLVMEVVVRRGRVIDPSDDSEGTRDRPPGSEENQNPNAVPLDQNPDLQAVPQQGQLDTPKQGQPTARVTTNDGRLIEVAPVANNVSGPDTPVLSPQPPVSRAFRRWSAPLGALGLTAAAGGWSKRVDEALEIADSRAWQRLRRAGRLGRIIRPTETPPAPKSAAHSEYNGN